MTQHQAEAQEIYSFNPFIVQQYMRISHIKVQADINIQYMTLGCVCGKCKNLHKVFHSVAGKKKIIYASAKYSSKIYLHMYVYIYIPAFFFF